MANMETQFVIKDEQFEDPVTVSVDDEGDLHIECGGDDIWLSPNAAEMLVIAINKLLGKGE